MNWKRKNGILELVPAYGNLPAGKKDGSLPKIKAGRNKLETELYNKQEYCESNSAGSCRIARHGREELEMTKLLKYLKPYRKESIIGPLFKMLEACFELFVPLVMAHIIDSGIKNADLPEIFKMGVVLIIFGVIGLACSLTAQYFAAKAAVGFGTELRRDLFRHIQSFSYTELDVLGMSTLVTRMTSDINQVQAGVNLVLRLFLRSPFIVIGALIMAFTINVKIALIFLIAVPVLSFAIFLITKITIPMYKRVQKKLDVVLLKTREALTGARVVRAFCRQERETKEYEESTRDLMGLQLLVGKVSALLNPVTYVIVNLCIAAIVWYGGLEVDSGVISQGEVIALVNYMSQILLALVAMANLIISFTKAMASAGRIEEVFAEQSSLKESGASHLEEEKAAGKQELKKAALAVEMRHVSFAYKNAKEESLTDITFTARQGETIGIIGGTGSGKSTLVNLIPRFYDITQGELFINGREIKSYPLKELRAKIGIVPQKSVLFKGTIQDNMKWGREDATEEEIYKALEIAQAKDFVDEKPEGLDTMVSQGGKNLSGGQRQRLTIARAVVKKPEILILDDSASALDFATDAKLRKAISERIKNSTVFLVSQRATTIKNADKIIVLDDGKEVGYGTHEQLLESCEVYREICFSQLSKEEVMKHAK